MYYFTDLSKCWSQAIRISEDFYCILSLFSRRLQEKHTREKLRDHLKNMVGTQEELKEVQMKISEVGQRIKQAHQRQERLLPPGARWAENNMYCSYTLSK